MTKYSALSSILSEPDQLIFEAPMKKYTTFRVGGMADVIALVRSAEQLRELIAYAQAQSIPFVVIGAGSNLLVSDYGFPGIVIRLTSNFSDCQVRDTLLEVQSGIRLSTLAKKAAELALTGLEFAEGIPGTVGGGIAMNAGAYGGELSQVIKSVEVLDMLTHTIKTLSKAEMNFGYRHSLVQEQPYIIIRAILELTPGDYNLIQKTMQNFADSRKAKQPLNLPSAGSVFKRPEGHFVGTMIESLNLKGYSIGGAAISEKHAGFIVNLGNATAQDIYQLIQYVIRRVQEAYQIILEPEIKFIGQFDD